MHNQVISIADWSSFDSKLYLSEVDFWDEVIVIRNLSWASENAMLN